MTKCIYEFKFSDSEVQPNFFHSNISLFVLEVQLITERYHSSSTQTIK